MLKKIKEFIINFICISIVLFFLLGWFIIPIFLIYKGHPIYAFFVFCFFMTIFYEIREFIL